MRRIIFVILWVMLVQIAVADDKPAQLKKCALADSQITVNNPFPNWKYDSASFQPGANSCTLEKGDSAPNPVYVNTQIQVMFNDRASISVPLEDWFKDKLSGAQSEEGVSGVQASDTTLSGKKAKKLGYTKLWKSASDPAKSVKVFHEDTFVVEPGYALDITTYVPEPDAPKARPEIEQILKGIELK